MASDDEDLRINTLHALTKRSPRVVLEEHSHCEVPAGCGGVVLRWRDPLAGVPAVVRVASLGQLEATIDGAPLTNSWVQLAVGRHVVAVHLTGLPPGPSPFCFALTRQPVEPEDPPVIALSGPGVDWRVHPDPPATWRSPDHDLSDWAVAEDGTALLEAVDPDIAWRFRQVVAWGAVPLRVEGPSMAVRGVIVVAP